MPEASETTSSVIFEKTLPNYIIDLQFHHNLRNKETLVDRKVSRSGGEAVEVPHISRYASASRLETKSEKGIPPFPRTRGIFGLHARFRLADVSEFFVLDSHWLPTNS